MEYQLYELLLLFAVYSILGWFGSACMAVLTGAGEEKRRLCRGPCSIACGIGAMAVLLAVRLRDETFFSVFGAGVAAGLATELLAVAAINLLSGRKRLLLRWYHPILFGACAIILVFHLHPLVFAVIRRLPSWAALLLLLVYWSRFVSDLIDGISDALESRKKGKTVTDLRKGE